MNKYAVTYARAAANLHAPLVTVETHIAPGLPRFTLVGLPETAVRESKDRVRSAIIQNQFTFPVGRITVSLAPADLPKAGAGFDLAIAIGILVASKQLACKDLADYELFGELALSGELRHCPRLFPAIVHSKSGGRACVIPIDNADEAALVNHPRLYAAPNLLAVCEHLTGIASLLPQAMKTPTAPEEPHYNLQDILGHTQAKRALMIAATGGHSLLMSGPPGSGKSMLANRLPGILPLLNHADALTVASIQSLSNRFDPTTFAQRPFRAPHHSASGVAIVGGGSTPRPGEISLAHHGVLFLDELPEFNRNVLESLREPLESRAINIARAGYQITFPADFQLIAAMNPCPCGHLTNPQQDCYCSPDQVKRYQSRISGPLLDRIDLHIAIYTTPINTSEKNTGPKSSVIREQVAAAQTTQYQRQGKLNAALNTQDLNMAQMCTKDAQSLLQDAHKKMGFSWRVYHRLLKIAQTLADLAQSPHILPEHLHEALSYRPQID
ncbi:MAG: ATP-dependent protease [marine bacterium B5-7]|nr:MAG: ATP-dependent protease [marine bacterium B5-7]